MATNPRPAALARLDEAFQFERSIDIATYGRHAGKLRENSRSFDGASRSTAMVRRFIRKFVRCGLKTQQTGRIPLWTLRGEGGNTFFDRARYAAVLNTPPNREEGMLLFESLCGRCHRLRGRHGGLMGPDLSNLHKRTAIEIATEILFPSRSIVDGYEAYAVKTANGRKYIGRSSEREGIEPAD